MNSATHPAPAQPLKLHSFGLSGHCHRVELMLSLLGLPHEVLKCDLLNREQHTPRFLALNPLAQVPVLEDGSLVLADSNAILTYLALRYAPGGGWLRSEPVAAARLQRWFSLAASYLDFGPATARFSALIGREMDPKTQAMGHTLFARMEAELAEGRLFLVDDTPSLADVSLYSYTAHAPEGGVSLADYPQLREWLARVQALPGFIPMPATKTAYLS